MDPVKEALTTGISSSRTRNTAMISSVTLPNVALSKPPTRGPAWRASWSVPRPISPARGMTAIAEVMNTARSAPRRRRTTDTGTNASNQYRLGRFTEANSSGRGPPADSGGARPRRPTRRVRPPNSARPSGAVYSLRIRTRTGP